jgi:CBS-domain-containing membrane protein
MALDRLRKLNLDVAGDPFDKVSRLLDEIMDLSPEEFEEGVRRIEPDLYALFRRIERLHSLSQDFQQIDLSEDVYTMFRMLERKKVVRLFPFLSRAAGIF